MSKGDNNFQITLKNFYQGLSPLAHLNELTEYGSEGHASKMKNVDVLGVPDFMTQGFALEDLTNGNQAGAVDELIRYIMEKGTASNESFAIGDTKLFRITPTTVSNGTVGGNTWPKTITGATEGASVIQLLGNVYYFYNKSSGGDIGKFDLSTSFDDDWGTTGSHGSTQALEDAPHPVATKEDIALFGNGQYVGRYIANSDSLDPRHLDLGNNHEVADIAFSRNTWWIAENGGFSGSERNEGRILLYDGSAIGQIISDETGVGLQRIGFLFVDNGTVFVAYEDLSMTSGYKIGYISGGSVKPVAYFSGSLPNYQQKTLYKNAIAFISGGDVYSSGAIIDELQFQISQIAPGGYDTVGAISAPFGTPLVSSSDGGSNHRLAKFSGRATDSTWRSPVMDLTKPGMLGTIDKIEVITNKLGANARCDLQIECDQRKTTKPTTALQISGENKVRHVFRQGLNGNFSDFNILLDWSNGDSSDECRIRKIMITGHYVQNK